MYAEDENHNTFSSGSGFFINSSGVGITNFHVLQGAYAGRIKCTNGKEYRIKHVIDYSPEYDIVKFQVECVAPFPFLRTKESLPIQGEPVISYSNPLGNFENTVSTGIVSAIRDYKNYEKVIQITAPISNGSSGSPVMNSSGDVIGIATFGVESGQSLNFAVSILQVRKLNKVQNIPISHMQINACETPNLKKALSYIAVGELNNAFQLLDGEIKKNPYNHLAYYYRGLWNCRLENYNGIDDLLRACSLDTVNYMYIDKTAEYVKNAIIRGVDMNMTPPQEMFELAINLYKRCISINPYKPDAYAGLGYLSFYLSKLEDKIGATKEQTVTLRKVGIKNLDIAIELFSTPIYYTYRAHIYAEMENWGRAILDCTNALSIDNENFRAYLMRGTIRACRLFQVDEGILDLIIAEGLAETNKDKSNVYLELSSAYWTKYLIDNSKKVHIRQAIDYAKKAYTLDPLPIIEEQLFELSKLL